MFSSVQNGPDAAEQAAGEGSEATSTADADAALSSGTRDAERLVLIGQMTSGIAHDFRNVLCVIQSSLNLIERNDGDPRKISECLSAAQDGIERGLRLTSRLVQFASEQEREPRLASVNDLLLEMKPFLRFSVGGDIELKLELAPSLPSCFLDRSQFCAAILNLVVNARDALAGSGSIIIRTAPGTPENENIDQLKGCVHVRVEDDGPGMSTEVLSRIFKRHFTTKGDTGSGLGLPQVHAFVEQIGGRIHVLSDVGVGTTFDLAIPIAPA